MKGIEERLAAISVFIADLGNHVNQPTTTAPPHGRLEPQHVHDLPVLSSVQAELGNDLHSSNTPVMSTSGGSHIFHKLPVSEHGDTTRFENLNWDDEGVAIEFVGDRVRWRYRACPYPNRI